MGLVSEEEKYSAGRVVRLEMKAFFRSSSARLVEENDDVKEILRLFLECFYIHQDKPPKDMDGRIFKDAVLGLLPRRFTGKESYLEQVPKVVHAYIEYLKRETQLKEIGKIEKTIADLDSRFIKAVKKVKARDRIPDEPPTEQIVRNEGKLGRNDPCPCGSGKKYKKCCFLKEK